MHRTNSHTNRPTASLKSSFTTTNRDCVVARCLVQSFQDPSIACSRYITMQQTQTTSSHLPLETWYSISSQCLSTYQEQVGVTLLPLDGNINRHSATIAHAGGITSLTSSFDGHYLFTSSGDNATVHMWQVNPDVLAASYHLGGEGLDPFVHMLDGWSSNMSISLG